VETKAKCICKAPASCKSSRSSIDDTEIEDDTDSCEAAVSQRTWKDEWVMYLNTNEPGELTHIDLWGKYDVLSVNRNQYYIVMVNDATRMMTVNFLKTKDRASQAVKDYMAYLKTRGQHPKAMRMDHGKEFINDKLSAWCCE
jgi:hypothetical protein